MFIVQSLGREPVSLLGKDYAFIYDHVRRNYLQGTYEDNKAFDGCYKFTFYKEVPTVKFADPYNDPMNLLDRWEPDFATQTTMGNKTTIHYSESNDGYTNNKHIDDSDDLDNGNPGVATPGIASYGPGLTTCDLIKKTNDNFNHGKYQTLVARFHTNADESKSQRNPTQTANSPTYGMSHGRNLLKINPTEHNGYDNPYCRVWTYHHQYNQIARQIRPFDEAINQETLESLELSGDYNTVGFRTSKSTDYGFDGGSKRLDKYSVLNYQNGTVNIAPTAKIKDYFEHRENDYDKQIIATKKCMFSIENLAWRDEKTVKDEFDAYGLSPEQKGPLGGRIMWFPPYDLTFNEDVSVKWNTNDFIGRGESVYTYTNTERRGNLSFTLLIDHPAILDYWTGHERNGMKNQGVDLAEGNSGGIDNRDNQENTLLRFFAGCDVLSAKPQDYKVRSAKPEVVPEPEQPKEPAPKEPDEVKTTERKKICAILYYPNNYSGKDDNGGKVNPIYYLMNGIGTQKIVNKTTKNADDLALDINSSITVKIGEEGSATNGYGGYEMGSYGISVATKKIAENYETVFKTYADTASKERKAQYLTDENGTVIIGNDNELAKIVGSKAMGLGSAKIQKNLSGASHLWYRKRYYYRVDKAYENQDFSRPESYIDAKSFQLNAKGFNNVRQHSNVIKNFGLEDDSDTYKLVSFADIFVAFEGDDNVVKDKSTTANVELVRDVFKNKEKYSNIKISFNGHASFQGYSASNNDLAKNRALTFKRWLKEFKETDGAEFGEPKIINQPREVKKDTGELDDELVKIWRSASIVIEYDETNVTNAATAESVKAEKDAEGKAVATVDRVEIKNKETSSSYIDFIRNLGSVKGTNGKTLAETAWEAMGEIDGKDYLGPLSWNYDDKALNKGISLTQSVVKRYDNEGEFFETLTKEAPFLHHLISEKIKYFDPAYHSISPEGFNARLTFLHQCTRQGATVEQSAFDASTAYNLAFGRPPVCVLRLGDFYYTKIVITSLNIQYENAQWDMNPEGIGMMPMFAKITINFNFLGGSDLAGPIARLQNAVSFNYYANTSVYDNRAEKVEYDPNGSGKEIKFKGFTYPSIYGRYTPTIEVNGETKTIQREEKNREDF
jgi:outer membrane protein OmpA-like peptidoglycan-associated protein